MPFAKGLYIVLFLHQTTTYLFLLFGDDVLYIVLFLHQTTTMWVCGFMYLCCISYYSYIKPQLFSSEGVARLCCISYYSYIKPQLERPFYLMSLGCISYYSYIKPQLRNWVILPPLSCISYYSYIKPQLAINGTKFILVVYRTIPTSNHNPLGNTEQMDYVVYRTIPTSNHNRIQANAATMQLYIVLFLHQTTTYLGYGNFPLSCISYYYYIKPQRTDWWKEQMIRCISYYSYIKPQLNTLMQPSWDSCISYYSYIKPQLCMHSLLVVSVVYRTIPTSNHNYSLYKY